jgi:hypothetical protein
MIQGSSNIAEIFFPKKFNDIEQFRWYFQFSRYVDRNELFRSRMENPWIFQTTSYRGRPGIGFFLVAGTARIRSVPTQPDLEKKPTWRIFLKKHNFSCSLYYKSINFLLFSKYFDDLKKSQGSEFSRSKMLPWKLTWVGPTIFNL